MAERFYIRGILVALTLVLCTAVSTNAFADLFKYQKPNGEILITSEKRSDLKLVEVIDGGTSSKKRSNKVVRRPSAAQSRTRVPKNKKARMAAFDDIIREASEAYDIPFGFIKAVVKVESNFNPNAVSHAGAMGLMQLMPRTAASLNVTDPFNPRQNIFGGAKFLRILTDRYDGDINLILAAYNAGDAAVARYDGIPYAKTRGYVSSVYKWYRNFSVVENED